MRFASRVKAFNRDLSIHAALPPGIAAMNPFAEGGIALQCADAFYDRFYNDDQPRTGIFGINPGRHGSALTGVPFTDFKRLESKCGIPAQGHKSHEPSSEFVYAVVDAMGGPQDFYRRFYINSVCPLGFVRQQENGSWVNHNYYDSKELKAAMLPFMVETMKRQIALGLRTDVAFIMGAENARHFAPINAAHGFFGKLVTLPHPRYVVQYKRREMERYVADYVHALTT